MRKPMNMLAAIMLTIAVFNTVGCKKQEKDSVKPEVETSSVTNITETNAVGGGVVISDGGSSIIERGVCWSKEHNPVVSDYHVIVGGGVGSFTCTLVDLEPNTTYYLRAYAINSVGIAYGSETSFITLQNSNLPTVDISETISVTSTTALCYGSIIDSGSSSIIEKGFCWNTAGNPTIEDNYYSIWWTESFYAYINNLAPNTTYYVRAYAKNNEGIGYSQEISFTTSIPPTISILTGYGFIGDGDVIELDEYYKFGFQMTSSVGLSTLKIIIDDFEWSDIDISGSEYFYVDSVLYTLERDIIGESTFTATVTDLNGETSTASFTVGINEPSIHPLIVRDFEWIRTGAQSGTGLEEFGLCWISNAKAPHAQIKPLEGVILYIFDPTLWDGIITDVEKVAAFYEIGVPIAVYNNVDVTMSSVYDDVIGTQLPDGTLYLLHVTRCDVTMESGITKWVISGEAK